MAANNSCNFVGVMGQDPEMQFLPNENATAMVKFSLAITEGYGDDQKTHWFPFTMFGKRAEAFNDMVARGQRVAVEALAQTYRQEMEGNKGITRVTFKAVDWTFAGESPNGKSGGNGGQRRSSNSNRGNGGRSNSGYRNNNGGGRSNGSNRGNGGRSNSGYRNNNRGGNQQRQADFDDGAYEDDGDIPF